MKKRFFCMFLVCCLGLFALGAQGKSGYSAAELKRMSIFLSNFTEQGLRNLDVKELAAANPPATLVSFGLWHNYINNYKSRIRPCKAKGCKWGGLTIEGRHVAESVKKYFDVKVKLVSVTEADSTYHYDGKLYHFDGADGEATYYARVSDARPDASGNIRMTGELYNVDDESDKLGKFEAVAKPHTFGGKNTWAILSMKTTHYSDDADKEQSAADGQADADEREDAGFLPVFLDGHLVGGFGNGEWLEGNGGVLLNGNAIDFDEVNEEAVEEINRKATLELARVKEGRKLVYFTPKGKAGNGVMTGVKLLYTEAAGVESEIQFSGYSPEHQKLIVGVAAGINAVPAPTTRSRKDKGFVFSCEYKGVKYSVELQPQASEKGESHGTVMAGRLFVGESSWDIELGDENSPAGWPGASQGEELESGFFDLDGDGALEFIINSPGPNGSMYLFRADAENGPKALISVYTGAE